MNNETTYFNSDNDYLSFYGIDSHKLSDYKQEKLGHKTVVHVFEPSNRPNKTVLLIHGYFDHTGSFKNVINHFLHLNYRVIGYDLEGHGLSSGERGVIGDFSEYVTTLQMVLRYCEISMFWPNIVIGHSTGAAIITEYLLKARGRFEKIIYLAPLVRVANWHYTLSASKIVPKFKRSLVRKFAENSSDVEFLTFAKNDPLQCRFISIPWVLAMINWNQKVEELPPSTQEIYIIQGTLDKTVDWKYNVQFLCKKFPFSQIALIDNGRHQIMNEDKLIKSIMFKLIDNYLQRANS